MLPRLLTLAFLFILFFAATAHADSVVITGGTAETNRTSSTSSTVRVDVVGNRFHLTNSGNLERVTFGCPLCANGETVRFGEAFTGTNDPVGGVSSLGLTVGGIDYGRPDFHTFVNLGVSTLSTTLIVPPGNPETFTILLPFTASGSYRIDSNITFQTVGSGTITGQGVAEVLLRRDGVTSFYVTQSVIYRFENPAATPEPASLTLLGLGGGGAWLLKRRRAKG